MIAINDKVVLEILGADAVSPGGIVLPSTAKSDAVEARVVSVGPGKFNGDGRRGASQLHLGWVVLISPIAGVKISVEGKEYRVVREDDIIVALRSE